jgi:hypothetical protein
VRVERRGAVGTDDPQVLEAIVVRHAVDVVKHERHVAAAPQLTLAAQLA